MSPKILDTTHCPACKTELPQPPPRICPNCGGSLQQRYLKAGCLTSAPKVFLIGLGLWWLTRTLV